MWWGPGIFGAFPIDGGGGVLRKKERKNERKIERNRCATAHRSRALKGSDFPVHSAYIADGLPIWKFLFYL